jgi:predicted porin
MYTFGGKAGDNVSQRVMSARLAWQVGQFMTNLGYFNGRDPTGTTDATVLTAYTIGVTGTFGNLKVGADLSNYRNPSIGSNQNFYALMGSWTVTPDIDDRIHSSGNANLFKLAANYLLSKRTVLYADAGYVRNGSTATFGLQNLVPAAIGKDQLGLMLGVRHYF